MYITPNIVFSLFEITLPRIYKGLLRGGLRRRDHTKSDNSMNFKEMNIPECLNGE